MPRYAIKRMPGPRAEHRAGRYAMPYPKNMGEIEAKTGEEALAKFAENKLGPNYTNREFRPERRYSPAFLVARCWNGERNYHDVRFEAWRADR